LPSRSSADRHGTGRAGTVRPLSLLFLALLAAASTFLLFRETLAYGFDYDDYYFVKPFTRDDVLRTFTGSWDTSGIMVPFYRPLTIAFYALRFEAFGLNAEAHHAASLVLFALAALLAALFALRATGSAGVAAGVLVAFVVHPSMPAAQVAWVTNQMHLLASLLVLSGLVWWQVAARRGLAWWLPLLVIATAAFMVKEDCVMLLPAIVTIHWLYRRSVDRTVPPVPKPFVAAAVLLVGGLLLLRQEALGELGGYGRRGVEQAWHNFTLGLKRVFWLVHARLAWQKPAGWFAALLPAAALAAWWWTPRGTRFVILSGAALALLFNLPFVLVTKHEQMHLVALGAALVFGGAAAAILQTLRRRPLRIVAGVVLAAGFTMHALVGRSFTANFAPFGPVVLSHDVFVQEWAAVPRELREYLERKKEPGAAGRLSPNPVDELRLVGFGLHETETAPDGTRYRWMRQPRAEMHVTSAASAVTIPIRHERGAFGEPAHVTISLNGRVVDTMAIDDGEWKHSRISLRGLKTPALARMHRITIEIPHAWVPARVIPASTDERVLGLQIGEIETR